MRKLMLVIVPFLIITLFAGCSSYEEVELEPLAGDISDLGDEFVAYLVEDEFESAYAFFCVEMRRAMSKRELQRTWQQLLGQVGAYVDSVEQQADQVEGYDVIILTTAFE